MAQKTNSYLQNIISLDVQQLCINKVHGEINFLNSYQRFAYVQNWAKRLEKCEAYLNSDEYFDGSFIKNFLDEFYSLHYKIKNFSPTHHETKVLIVELRDKIEQEVKDLYDKNYDKMSHEVILAELTYKLKKADEILAKFGNAKDTTEIKSDISKYSSELKNELFGEHDKIKTEISNLKAARASENLSTHFSNYAKKIGEEIEGKKKDEMDKKKDSWWRKLKPAIFPIGIKGKIRVLRLFNYAIPIIFVVCIILLSKLSGLEIISLERENLIELGIFFSVMMSLLFSHLKSATRDLNILKNSKESYEHRAKVAETFIAFLASESKSESKDETTKSEMAKQAAIAMFQRVPSGYLTKDQIEPISHPLTEILLKHSDRKT